MTPTLQEHQAAALTSFQIAVTWRERSNVPMELTCLLSGAMSLLGCAVVLFDDASSGIEYLRLHDVNSVIKRTGLLNDQLYESLLGLGTPQAAVNNSITIVHLAWLVREWETAKSQLVVCVDRRVSKFFPQTRFWAEYNRGIQCLVNSEPYEPNLPPLRGYEKYWAMYLTFISDLTNERDDSESRSKLAQGFAKRNRDNRLIDWQMIDGDGKHPVRWDFREASILAWRNEARKYRAKSIADRGNLALETDA